MDDAVRRAPCSRCSSASTSKGYIYRDNRIVNWCPSCASAISDLEVRYEHAADTLYEVRYPIKGAHRVR